MNIKFIRDIIIIVIANVFFIWIAIWIFQGSEIDLGKVDKLQAKIEKIFESRKSYFRNSSRNLPLKQLVIKLDGLDQYLTYYRPFGGYGNELQKLHIGDLISVFYKPNDIKFELYRIERGGEVIISEAEWAMREKIASSFPILATILMDFLFFKYLRFAYKPKSNKKRRIA